jgi:diacylglycerol kinase family enzyme
VLNVAAGEHPGPPVRTTIESVLLAAGRRFEVFDSDEAGGVATATRRAVELACATDGAVVAAGGDGTLSAVAQAALAADRPFGAIALGTFNYFARDQGLPLEPEAATQAVLSPALRPVQVGLVNGKPFLVNASLGLYPQLLEDREQVKARFGRRRAIALLAALGTIVRADTRLSLEIETADTRRVLRTAALIVGNNRLQLEQLGLPEAPAVDHGRLVAMFVRPTETARLLWLLARAFAGRLDGSREVERLAVRRLQVSVAGAPRRGASLQVALDGETLQMPQPLTFEVAPRPLRLIAPR